MLLSEIIGDDAMKKYIVCTTIYDTQELKIYNGMRDWQLVIVSDLKTPEIKLPGAHILTVEEQKKLPYEICKIIPWNSIQRRNIGYVYALSQGADVICTVDNDNFPLDNWGFPYLGKKDRIQTVCNVEFFDVVHYVTQGDIWHRGTLYENTKKARQPEIITNDLKVGIQANLWLDEPDTDGICRISRDMESGKQKIEKNFSAPLAISKNVFSPFNSQNTAFIKDFVVTAFLPFGGYFDRMDDIWAAYITERIMWETDYHLCFGPASVKQDRNPHNLWKDIQNEIAFSSNLKELLDYLRQATLTSTNVLENFVALSEQLEKKHFSPKGYDQMWKAWIKDIERYY